MKFARAAMATVLTAVVIILASASRETRQGGHPRAASVAALPASYEETEQAAVQHAETLEALATLRQAEAMLETGNSDGVDDELRRAEAALSGRTRLDVEAAREALAREDLFPARQYLAAALAERRALR